MTRAYPPVAVGDGVAAAAAEVQTPAAPRRVLMLQGPPSPLWPELRDALEEAGHAVVKVHLGLGDALFWGRRPALSYRGRRRGWRAWLDAVLAREGITDVLYYADRVPQHAEALEAARAAGARAWALEFGYLRPDWLTLEPEGMGAMSRFPRDRAGVAALARGRAAPDGAVRYPHPSFVREAAADVSFHLAQSLGLPLYPHWRHDWPLWPPLFYLAWIPQVLRGPRQERAARRAVADLLARGTAFDLVPLQIAEDYQIRAASPYGDLMEFVEEVLASFAAHAPPDRELVFKIHPLDVGLRRWERRVPEAAARHGVAARVRVVRGGDLDALIAAARSVVVVNSTVGLKALRAGVATVATGTAVYDVAGVTHGAGLDAVWTAPEPPEPDALDALLRALTAVQVRGSFYAPEGRAEAVRTIVARLACGGVHAALAANPRAGVRPRAAAGPDGVTATR